MTELNPPTEEEIARLPRRAAVAFAARCVRQALVLYERYRKLDPAHIPPDVTASAEMAERIAGEEINLEPGGIEVAEQIAAGAARAAKAAPGRLVGSLASAAAAAADTAHEYMVNARRDRVQASRTLIAVRTAYSATNAFAAARFCGDIDIPAAIRTDFERLTALAKNLGWGDHTPVPPEVFDPNWQASSQSRDRDILFEIEIPDGVADEVAAAFVRKLADQADDLHRAFGGHGLKIESIEIYGDDTGSGREKVAS